MKEHMQNKMMKINQLIRPVQFSTLLLVLWAYSVGGHAACWYLSGSGDGASITLPAAVTIQRDTAPGTVVWDSGWFTSAGGTRVECAAATYYTTFQPYDQALALAAGYTNVYKTEVAGIGIKVFSLYGAAPLSIRIDPGSASYDFLTPDDYAVQFIYLGGDISGSVSGKSFYLARGGIKSSWLNMYGSTRFIKVACSLNSTSINVPLGDVSTVQFTAIGTTAGDKTFDLGLNCDKEARINVALAGTQNTDTTDTSVLALTNAGQTGTAKGIGVQLLYGGVPLKINNNIVLKTSVGGQETLPFTARYYQTNNLLEPGKANSSATLNITYQ